MDKYKAYLVAKGFNQLAGIYYTDCFSPVAKLVAVHLFLAIATSFSWLVDQVDINNTYLHGQLTKNSTRFRHMNIQRQKQNKYVH